MKRAYLRVSPEDELPENHRSVRVTLEYPNGKRKEAKVYFLYEFKLKHGKRNCKVLNWFKEIEIPEDVYKSLLDYPTARKQSEL